MRLIISIILIAFIALGLEYFFPWWSVAVVCFLVTMFFQLSSGKAFIAGFLGVFLMWLIVAIKLDYANEHILSSRMAELILTSDNSLLFMIIAALVGGLVGGLAGWSGALVRKNLL